MKWGWVKTWSPGPQCCLTFQVGQSRSPGFDPQPNSNTNPLNSHRLLAPSAAGALPAAAEQTAETSGWTLTTGRLGRETRAVSFMALAQAPVETSC